MYFNVIWNWKIGVLFLIKSFVKLCGHFCTVSAERSVYFAPAFHCCIHSWYWGSKLWQIQVHWWCFVLWVSKLCSALSVFHHSGKKYCFCLECDWVGRGLCQSRQKFISYVGRFKLVSPSAAVIGKSSLCYILILPSLCLGLPRVSLLQFSDQNPVCISVFHHTCHMLSLSHPPWFDHPNIRFIQKISSFCEYCHCSAAVTVVRMRAKFVDSVARHGHNLQTFEQCLRIVLCFYNV